MDWESCEIECVTLTKRDRTGRRICRLVARASNGSKAYVAATSLPFWVTVESSGPGLSDALRELRWQLTRAGWQEVSEQDGLQSNRFRRPIQAEAGEKQPSVVEKELLNPSSPLFVSASTAAEE